jgi:hypothetical protein
VGVVTTSVHPTRVLGAGNSLVGLVNRESVEIGAKADTRVVSDVEPEPGLGAPTVVDDTALVKRSGNQSRGLVLLVGRLRISMQKATKLDCSGNDVVHEIG